MTLLLIRGVLAASGAAAGAVVIYGFDLAELLLALVPILFMYAPVALCRWRGVDSWDYPLALPAFSDRATWWREARWGLLLSVVITVPFIVAYHFWQTRVFGYAYEGIWPPDPLKIVGYFLFFVAIPEEMFYRGYVQTRLDEIFPTRWRVLGADVGPALLVTSVVFAVGHSLVVVQWWHFAIFFPSLLFGWLRARTGGIVAASLFHAWCDILVRYLDTLYGVLEP